jgi:hypothetical protein
MNEFFHTCKKRKKNNIINKFQGIKYAGIAIAIFKHVIDYVAEVESLATKSG